MSKDTYVVTVRDIETQEIESKSGRIDNYRRARKLKHGYDINLNTEKFYTVVEKIEASNDTK